MLLAVAGDLYIATMPASTAYYRRHPKKKRPTRIDAASRWNAVLADDDTGSGRR